MALHQIAMFMNLGSQVTTYACIHFGFSIRRKEYLLKAMPHCFAIPQTKNNAAQIFSGDPHMMIVE